MKPFQRFVSGYIGLPQYLLNQYPGAVTAYSFRRLNNESNNTMRVRRSDGVLYNTVYAGATTDLAALSTFVGSTNATVEVWYDQAPGCIKHAGQLTVSNQPLIYSAGSLVTAGPNNLPAVRFDTTDLLTTDGIYSNWTTGAGVTGNSTWTAFIVYRKTALTQGRTFGFGNVFAVGGAAGIYEDGTNGAIAFAGANDYKISPLAANDYVLTTITKTPGTVDSTTHVYRNGVDIGTTGHSTITPNINANYGLFLGQWANYSTDRFQGEIAELIIYNTDQSSNRAAIEANIAAYYGITLS